jgi:1-acyl-sn-glycerol-3-phosphate acyltransferase
VPRRWPWLANAFLVYCRRYVRSHFHALRLLRGNPWPDLPGPLVVYMNHPGWWDPIIGLVVAHDLAPDRVHYCPIDARALERYPLFERLGFFGVDLDSPRGAVAFLRTVRAILAEPRSTLWITPQGRFTDPRVRPNHFKPGLAKLASEMTSGAVLPLAIEYPFWSERFPEALVALGPPWLPSEPLNENGRPGPTDDGWRGRSDEVGSPRSAEPQPHTPELLEPLLLARLTAAQDLLAAAAIARDPAAFHTLRSGRAGLGGMYDAFGRFRAWLRGRPFSSEHGDLRP